MTPTLTDTATYLHWLDQHSPGLGSAIAIHFQGQFTDMGWVREGAYQVRSKRTVAVKEQTGQGVLL